MKQFLRESKTPTTGKWKAFVWHTGSNCAHMFVDYRYKMIKMNLKQESRLNGVKTNIFNVEDVADDLRVPAQAVMKWMSSELGANLEGSSIIKGNF